MNRRGFLRLGLGAAAAIAAPALVQRANIMAVKAPNPAPPTIGVDWGLGAGDDFFIVMHPDLAKAWENALRDGVSLMSNPPIIVRKGEIAYLGGVRIVESRDLFQPPRFNPPRIETLKLQQTERTLRQLLEPRGSRRWV